MLEMGWIILWYIASLLAGSIAFPITYACCTGLNDRGYSICRVVALLVPAWLIWLLGTRGIHVTFAMIIAIILFIGASYYIAKRHWQELHSFLKQKWRTIALTECIFLFSFLLFSIIIALNPVISGAEKYFDFGIFNAVQRADHLPLGDIWNADQPMKYHWFGYVFLGLFSKMLGTPSQIGYNLSLAFLFALTVMISFGLSFSMTKKWKWALFAVGFLAIFGNLAGTLELVQGPWKEFNIWTPTRVIDVAAKQESINEFPFFSFWWRDLHPHVIAIPIFLVIIVLSFNIFRAGIDLKSGILFTILLGGLRVANAWDWPAAALLLGIVLLAHWWHTGKNRFFMTVLLPGILITAISLLIFYGFPQIGTPPLKITTIKSVIKEWILVFGPFAFLAIAYLPSVFTKYRWPVFALFTIALFAVPIWFFIAMITAALIAIYFVKQMQEEETFGVLLAIAGFSILLGTEFFYIADWLSGGHQRMNTLFKFGLCAWMYLGLAMPELTKKAWERMPRARLALGCLIGLIVLAGLAYPFAAIRQNIASNSRLTLDGWTELRAAHPADYASIVWLTENIRGKPIVLEAPGESYTHGSRISAHTGLPTLVGWPSHLYQHGVDWNKINDLRATVTKIYNGTSLDEATPLLKQYNVTYVYVGEIEKQLYNEEALAKFSTLPVAFKTEGAVLYNAA